MSSNMVDRYLDREGILEDDTVAAVKTEGTTLLLEENQRLSEGLAVLKEGYQELQDHLGHLQGVIDNLKSGKGIQSLLAQLVTKAGPQSTRGQPESFQFDAKLSEPV